MPPLNLLLLPLLGGFVFVSKWYVTRYYTLRSDGYRLVFAASIAGAAFLFLACLGTSLASKLPLYGQIAAAWHQVFSPAHSGKAVLAFLIGVICWWPANRLGRWITLLSDGSAVERAISHKGDPMEMFFRRAMGSKNEVSLTLKTGEIYVGRLCRNFNPAFPMETIGIIPSLKGHMHKKNFKFIRDFDYRQVQEQLELKIRERVKTEMLKRAADWRGTPMKNPLASARELVTIARAAVSKEENLYNYEVVLPVSEILSASIYDEKLETSAIVS